MRLSNTADDQPSPTKIKSFPKIRLSQKLKRPKKFKLQHLKLICIKCDAKFLTWWDIQNHWKSTGHKTPELCRWCRKKTYTLQSHLCKQHWDLASMCSYCGQLFMFQEDLEKHMVSHDGTEYRCCMCGRRRNTEELFRSHVYNHFLYEKYGCNVCEKRFRKKKNLEKHLVKVHFICQYCGNNCNSVQEFNEHVKIHYDLKCVLCQKVFSQKNRLKYHYQLQHGHQDFYKCSICFQRFAVKAHILDHMKLRHNGVSNFSCKTCDMPFMYWKQYRNHFEKVHAKPLHPNNEFKCSFCDFSTDLKVKLQWHVEKTSGSGFFCKKCQLHLECRGNFDKHIQSHKGECIWTCDYCPRSYTTNDTLNHHISIAHKEVMMVQNPQGYPCLEEDCDKYYTVKSSLARHIRKVHSDSIITNSNLSFSENISHSFPDNTSNSFSEGKNLTCNEKIDGFTENTVICQTPLKEKVNKKNRNEESEIHLNDKLETDHVERSRTECLTNNGHHHMINLSNMTEVNVYHCYNCKKLWFAGKSQFQRHMSTHKDEVWEKRCVKCNVSLESPEEAVRHYVEDHLKVKFIQ